MNYRQLGNTDFKVSELSFGTWAIGGAWGKKDDQEALKALDYAIGNGVNFFITPIFNDCPFDNLSNLNV